MKKFHIKTHGCKSNQLESSVIKEKMCKNGYLFTENQNEADIFILNSCSVTENADNEALRTLRNIKNKNNSVYTVLTGCSAQLNSEKIKNLNYIDLVLGNNDKFDIVKKIEENKSIVSDIFSVEKFNNQIIHEYKNTRGYLKIQDGCNNYCTYCTIPFARGKSRSNSIKNIIEQVKIYTEIGIQEVVLTGIHIGQWGEDLDKSNKLVNLLEELEKTEIKRYRLGSLNTLEITDELLNFLGSSDKFCPHFHLSLQSLTDKTLKAMNRHYTAQSCIELMDKICNIFEKPFLGSDIIVGFPGENDEDFEITVKNVINSKLSNIHVFPYSIRKNTIAGEMSDQIDEKTKQNRANTLHKLAKEKYERFIKDNIGRTEEVLIEKRPDKNTGLLKGVTRNYLNVLIESDNKELNNTIQKVKILNRKDDKLFCNII